MDCAVGSRNVADEDKAAFEHAERGRQPERETRWPLKERRCIARRLPRRNSRSDGVIRRKLDDRRTGTLGIAAAREPSAFSEWLSVLNLGIGFAGSN